jgi:methionyl aminopeptidase
MAGIQAKSPPELAKMRQAGRLVAEVLQLMEEMARPGATTLELDKAAARYIKRKGGKAAFKGYRGFPAHICTSINEEVVHGIPGRRALKEGDLLKVDAGVIWEGYFGDAAVTLPIGDVSEDARRLLESTRQALDAGIAAVRDGVKVSEVAGAVQRVAEESGFSVVTEYTGHGIGRALHEDPKVPNFVAPAMLTRDVVLHKGVTVAIEPMLNAGTHRTRVLGNGWTVVTRDGKLSAHFEHTVAVDQDGPVILTLP